MILACGASTCMLRSSRHCTREDTKLDVRVGTPQSLWLSHSDARARCGAPCVTRHAEWERSGYTHGMNSVSYALRPPTRSFRALAGIVALVAQFVAAVLAPAADAHAGASAPQHVEVAGTHLHYSHNPTDCASCAAQQLVGLIERAHAQPLSSAAHHTLRTSTPSAPSLAAEFSPSAPRAPPSSSTRTR
jgi:hypothetical protein